MTGIATSLLGRWASGEWVYRNPNYVPPKRGLLHGYTGEEECTLTESQKRRWASKEVTEKIVAVTVHGDGRSELRMWVLIDGKPEYLESDTVVMPPDWTPPTERL